MPDATIYVLGGLFPGTEGDFTAISARPVLNSLAEIGAAEVNQFSILEKSQSGASGCLITFASRVGLNWVKVIFSLLIIFKAFLGSGMLKNREQPLNSEAMVSPVPPAV